METWTRSLGSLAVSTLVLFSASTTAEAASLSITPFGVHIIANVTLLGVNGIDLPETGGVSLFAFGFVIPDDYRPNTRIRIGFSWFTEGTNCDIAFAPVNVSRTRRGNPFSVGLDGLTPGNGEDFLSAGSQIFEGRRKTYYLNAGQGFADQRPGDAIIALFRT